MTTLFFNGWGQQDYPFRAVFSGVDTVEYMRHVSLEAMFSDLLAKSCDTAIGWSLGGQLVIRAVLERVLKPRHIILIAAPYRFLHPQFPVFYRGMEEAPETTLQRFSQLMCMGDSRQKAIRRMIGAVPYDPGSHYLTWLERLNSFDCTGVDFAGFPPTLLIHGKNDAVVPVVQAEMFLARLPQARLELFDQAGHIPHLHDSERIRALLHDFTR